MSNALQNYKKRKNAAISKSEMKLQSASPKSKKPKSNVQSPNMADSMPNVNKMPRQLSTVNSMSESKHILSTVLYTDKIMDYHAAHVAREEWKSGTLGIMTQQHEGYNRFRYVIPRKMATPQPRTCAWIGERPKCPWCYAEKMRYRQNNECTCGECNSKKPCDHPTPVWLEYEQNNE